MEIIVNIGLWLASIYLLCGLAFAIVFVTKGVTVIDENARGTNVGFRIIIIPGITVLWPLLLLKWIKAAKK